MENNKKLITGEEALSTFLSAITINGSNVPVVIENGTANISLKLLPDVTSTDNGKILKVVEGIWSAATTVTVYSGNEAPSSNTGIDGDIYIQTS